MAIASRTFHSSGVSFKSIVYSGLGILLIVALFFIPEIVQFQRTVSGTSKAVSTMKTLQTAAVSIPKDPKDSQLSRIASLIDSGYLDRISNVPAKTEEVKAPEQNVVAQDGKSVGLKSTKTESKPENGPSWKSIKSEASKGALKKAHKEILSIIDTLPSDQKGSRFALLNFANGMEQTIDGNMEKGTTGAQAIRQLEKLHAACMKEFLREGVGQIPFKRFVGLDFGPAIGTWSAKLSGRLVPFNPQLTLSQISTSKNKISEINAPVKVGFQGYVVGDDVDRIEMISAGTRYKDLSLKNVDKNGFRIFKSERFDLQGKVLLKVHDKFGRVYQKLYSFYPRAKIFENGKGRYLIPKAASEYDNRLDRYFTYQVVKPSEVPDSFLLSQGFEKF